MNDEAITSQRIDELLAFLPALIVPERQFIVRWVGGEKTADGATTTSHPVYADDVLAFFRLAGQRCWSDYGYDPIEAHKMLVDDGFIQRATLERVKSMLTYCVRGERFSDGHWAEILRSGRITAILRRLAVLKDSMSNPV